MKRCQALNLLFLTTLCTSCAPAVGVVDTFSPMALRYSIAIIIIMGLIILVQTIRSSRTRNLSNTPKDSKASKPTPTTSTLSASTFEVDKSSSKDENITDSISNDSDSKVEAVKRYVQGTISDNNQPQINSAGEFSKTNQVINIHIEPDETKAQAATEIVNVPNGVMIKVKRVRAVEHTINIEWAATLSGKGEAGIKQLVSVSIQGEIQRIKGYVSQQTESVEYEITLNGEKHNQYKLVWMDIWLKGTADIQDNNSSYSQPFQFRDRTELKVVPFTDS